MSMQDFVTEFYLASDRADDSWLDMFAEHAFLSIGERYAHGKDAIRTLRANGSKLVKNRVHYLDAVYYDKAQPNVALATGRIDQDRLTDGMVIRDLEWAAKIVLEDGKIVKYTAFVHFPPLNT